MTTLRRVQAAVAVPVAGSDSFDVAMKCFPGRVRCGDFATVIHVDERRCGLVMVDGGGHGVSGIVQANAVLTAVRTAVAVSEDALMDPAGMFNAMNLLLSSSKARQVLPCVYLGIDMASGKMAYLNAGGMPPLLMVGAGRLVTLDQPSLVLGVDRDYLFTATRVDLPEAFRLVCYTDGLVEAASAGGEALGEPRLHEALLDRDAFADASSNLTRISNTWTSHLASAQADDDALALVISRG